MISANETTDNRGFSWTKKAPVIQANHEPAHCQPAPASQNATAGIPPLQPTNLYRPFGTSTKLTEGLDNTSQALSNLTQSIYNPATSSYPRWDPYFGQLNTFAPLDVRQQQQQPRPEGSALDQNQKSSTSSIEEDGLGSPSAAGPGAATTIVEGRQDARSATLGTDECNRDDHKETERCHRGNININEGINEFGRLVPNDSKEIANGAILSRVAVKYIHHLKENGARNVEKLTLEKLLMDEAMCDLQTQFEQMKRRWEQETLLRSRAEAELEALRSVNGGVGVKRRNGDATEGCESDGKRQRTD